MSKGVQNDLVFEDGNSADTRGTCKRLTTHKNLLVSCVDYLIAKEDERLPKRERKTTVPPSSSNQRVVTSLREFDRARELLKVATDNRNSYSSEYDDEIGHLYQEEQSIIEEFGDLDEFIRANLETQGWAKGKIKESEDRSHMVQGELENTLKAIEKLRCIENILKDITDSYQFNEDFLEKVAQSDTTRFRSSQDVVTFLNNILSQRIVTAQSFSKSLEKLYYCKEEVRRTMQDLTGKLLETLKRLKSAEEKLNSAKFAVERKQEDLEAVRAFFTEQQYSFEMIRSFVANFLTHLQKIGDAPQNVLELPVDTQFRIMRNHMKEIKQLTQLLKKSYLMNKSK